MSKSFVFCVNIFVLRKNGAYPAEKDTVTETSSPGHSITFSLNLYVHLLCPREMGNAHFSNVRPVSAKYSKTYKLSADFKCSSERKSCPNTPQFKRFWRFQEPFFKRFLSPFSYFFSISPAALSASFEITGPVSS